MKMFRGHFWVLSFCICNRISQNIFDVSAIDYMTIMQDKCTGGRNGLGTARTCVNSMVSSTLKTTLGNNLEDLGGALYPSFNTANEGEMRAYLD